MNFQGYDTQTHKNQVVRKYAYASSSSNYTFFSDQEQIWNERCAIQRESEKERMRHKIIAEEIKRQSFLEAEVRRELIIEREMPLMLRPQPLLNHHYPHRLEPEMVHGEMFIPENRRLAMAGVAGVGRGGDCAEIGKFEAVPFQRRPPSPSPKIKEISTFQPKDARIDITSLGKTSDLTVSGVKRKQLTPPLYAAAASSSGGVSLNSSKKRIEEWKCAICDVSATSADGLSDHIAGKKHQAKVAAVKAGNGTGVNIGLVKNKTPIMEQPLEVVNLSQCVSIVSKNDKTAGESLPKKFTRRCKLCKTGPLDDNGWNLHKKGKKHLKSLLNKERAKNKANKKRKHAICVG
ncbi:hypothetical protein CTI12_AA249430 [Artemisia annua]|uniref:C2H2-type domain-containing protein n=1 Tax=Artemisia annua TaxID=35608 RepID=A0A2U1NLX6_ARTAN|nr:hypothetical protein CTI12_AA249430 [Artemisia annua]